MFSVVRYVKARETYDPKALKDNFDLAQLLSTGAASRDLTEIYSPANPRNPVKEFGGNHGNFGQRQIGDLSESAHGARSLLDRRKIRVEHRASRLGVAGALSLFGRPMSNQMRFDNPLGFQATEYRRDQETAPSPNSGAAQTGARTQ